MWRHKTALVCRGGGRQMLASSKKCFVCVCVCGLASRSTSCYTKRMLGDGDREEKKKCCHSFTLLPLRVDSGKCSDQFPSSFMVLINMDVDYVYSLRSAVYFSPLICTCNTAASFFVFQLNCLSSKCLTCVLFGVSFFLLPLAHLFLFLSSFYVLRPRGM